MVQDVTSEEREGDAAEQGGGQMRRDIVLVHIPKTAGTSLRKMLELAAHNHLILRDYTDAPATTKELYELVHEQKRLPEFRQRFNSGNRGILLGGHFPARRYWKFFNAESFVTFIRDPVDRVLSEYNHFVTKYGWTGSFEEFLLPRRNVISKYLAGIDLERFGFIGMTEEFDASKSALASFVGAPLHFSRGNFGDYGAHPELLTRTDNRSIVADLNQDDIALCKKLRERRLRNPCAVGADASVAGGYRGRVHLNKRGIATGWLCNTTREFIVEVEVFADGRSLGFIKADRYNAKTKERGESRSGVCGFRANVC